jgi:hypothetical protein
MYGRKRNSILRTRSRHNNIPHDVRTWLRAASVWLFGCSMQHADHVQEYVEE